MHFAISQKQQVAKVRYFAKIEHLNTKIDYYALFQELQSLFIVIYHKTITSLPPVQFIFISIITISNEAVLNVHQKSAMLETEV